MSQTAGTRLLLSRYAITSIYSGFLATQGPNSTDTSLLANHIYDKVITARIELKKFWNAKIEGHFMDGYGSSGLQTQYQCAGAQNQREYLERWRQASRRER